MRQEFLLETAALMSERVIATAAEPEGNRTDADIKSSTSFLQLLRLGTWGVGQLFP